MDEINKYIIYVYRLLSQGLSKFQIPRPQEWCCADRDKWLKYALFSVAWNLNAYVEDMYLYHLCVFAGDNSNACCRWSVKWQDAQKLLTDIFFATKAPSNSYTHLDFCNPLRLMICIVYHHNFIIFLRKNKKDKHHNILPNDFLLRWKSIMYWVSTSINCLINTEKISPERGISHIIKQHAVSIFERRTSCRLQHDQSLVNKEFKDQRGEKNRKSDWSESIIRHGFVGAL